MIAPPLLLLYPIGLFVIYKKKFYLFQASSICFKRRVFLLQNLVGTYAQLPPPCSHVFASALRSNEVLY